MRVLVSGASGLIGRALRRKLEGEGHAVVALSRSRPSSEDTVRWDPERGSVDLARLEGHDAVVHLAGESIMGRWTRQKKARILESRVRGTRLLAESLGRLREPPRVMVSASASGYYGDRGDGVLTEESGPGGGFLSRVCREWERAAEPARRAGVRVAHPRFGIVLSREGGALAAMLPAFRLGIGGRVGSGRQWWSWVHVEDAAGALLHIVEAGGLEGPVNVCAPNPVRSGEFVRTLARVLGRPALFPLPAVVARAALGEMADELLLASARMEPARLRETGYVFRHPGLEGALRDLLER
ncbi:conserved hypothetical protein [Rubrobacter xylanophilus DSM 9941]|uniref:TIGR01777 family protein n=1 Tax=Rubrobacter xylanophilus (strain DSM 9941 / JCM 11954 / NBRC 16129 / PRD-1) TaxID=266117 RepID=Q1AY35_RUBXD|nr:TIGR01777 family oxidoreductase [Rubrobacter xylanophilus]ABG03693.1 conserved hypothetical protein [Rubrobacter xylanophilus DSM 9941]